MADGQPEQQPAPAAAPEQPVKWYKNPLRLQQVIVGLVLALVAVTYLASEIYQGLEQVKSASASVVRERDEAKKRVTELDRDLAKAKADATKAEGEAKVKADAADAAKQQAEKERDEAKQKIVALEERLEMATKVAEKCEVILAAKKPAAKPVTHAKVPTTPKPAPKPAAKPEPEQKAVCTTCPTGRGFVSYVSPLTGEKKTKMVDSPQEALQWLVAQEVACTSALQSRPGQAGKTCHNLHVTQ